MTTAYMTVERDGLEIEVEIEGEVSTSPGRGPTMDDPGDAPECEVENVKASADGGRSWTFELTDEEHVKAADLLVEAATDED